MFERLLQKLETVILFGAFWRTECHNTGKNSSYPGSYGQELLNFELMSSMYCTEVSQQNFWLCEIGRNVITTFLSETWLQHSFRKRPNFWGRLPRVHFESKSCKFAKSRNWQIYLKTLRIERMIFLPYWNMPLKNIVNVHFTSRSFHPKCN